MRTTNRASGGRGTDERRKAMGSGALSAGPQAPATPHKKMKKRKELNALIGLHGDGKKKGGGHHPLLRAPDTDTESESEEDYNSVTERHGRCWGRGGVMQCCRLCSPVCAFIVLSAVVMATIGLVWMQIALKENLDLLREQMRAVEASQRNSAQEIPKIKEDLIGKQRQLDEEESGELGLQRLWTNITHITLQISQLSVAVSQLKANLKSAADLINLPKKMEELQKSVATLGSTLTSVHHDVESLQATCDEQRREMEALQKDLAGVTSRMSPSAAPGTHATLQIASSLDELNATIVYHQQVTELQLHSMGAAVSNISQRVSILESNLLLLGRSEKRDNVSMENLADVNVNKLLNSTKDDSLQSPKKEESSVSDIQQHLQLIHALTTKPEDNKVTDPSKADSEDPEKVQSSAVKKYPRSLKRKSQRGSSPSLGPISKDELDEVFRKSSQGEGGKLTFQDLKDKFGGRLPELRVLEEYDEDGDGLFSRKELADA